jgi:hypothetical protein
MASFWEKAMFAWSKRYREILIVSGLILFLMGCASVPMAPQEMDVAAKRFEPSAGKANIYVTKTTFVGSGHALNLLVDGEFRGAIAHNTYFLFEVDPGTHTVAVVDYDIKVVTLHTKAGENYFLEVGCSYPYPFPPWGWIEPRDEEEGRETVLKTSLAQEIQLAP